MLYTVKKTVEVIIKSCSHYVIGVKKNQLKLYRHIKGLTSQTPVSSFCDIEFNKGRLERRVVRVFNLSPEITSVWKGAKQAIWIEREVRRNKRTTKETAYYISSFKGLAELYCYGIRSHWSIENSLHWVKDVCFKEDLSKIRTQNAPSNLSTLRNCVLNILRKNGRNDITKNIRLLANNIKDLAQMMI